jgi:hypothetical protein
LLRKQWICLGRTGSDISRSTRRSGSHTRASTDAGSLFSPSTHGSYLSPGGPATTQPLSLFSPLLPSSSQTIKTESAKDKQKEADLDALARHPSASLGRRAGDLIAFFESGAAVGTSRPASPTKSDGSFVSAASGAGGAGVVAGPRSSSGSSSYGQPMSPGKLSASASTFTRTFTGTATGSGNGSGSGSYTGSGNVFYNTCLGPF